MKYDSIKIQLCLLAIIVPILVSLAFFIFNSNSSFNAAYAATSSSQSSSAIPSLSERLQQAQQGLQSSINSQVPNTFGDTINRINNNSNSNNNASDPNTQQNNNTLITKLLAKNLENHIQKAGAILEITSKLPQVRDIPYANVLNQTINTLHGIPSNADIEKRQVAKNIINSNSGLYEVAFFMSNGDIYFFEPYSEQMSATVSNFAFRDYFQQTIKTNNTYLGNVIISKEVSPTRDAIIAIPAYSLKDNSTIVGVWVCGFDLDVLNKELQSFNIMSSASEDSDSHMRVVYVDSNGQKIVDSDPKKSIIPESFATLQSFKNAVKGESGSTTDTVDGKKIMVTYEPVNAFNNTWTVLLMQPIQ